MTRSERRAAERQANKAANKAAASLPFHPPVLTHNTASNPAAPASQPASNPSVLVGPSPSPACEPEPQLAPVLAVPEPGAPLPALSQITPARLAANRQNAQQSCGPKTAAGKAISAQNHVQHGLTRKNGWFSLLPSEDGAQYHLMLFDFMEEHKPETPTEFALLHALSEALWLRNRAQNYQNTCFDQTTGALVNEQRLALFLRYETTYNRAFNSALNQILKLKAEKRQAELGFVAQKHNSKPNCAPQSSTK